jgi:cytochrome c peroxidase
MNARRIHIAVLVVITLLLFGVRFTSETSKPFVFKIPKGWPKPAYDFTKNPITESGVILGRALFFDPVLSKDNSISCESCHLQFTGFTHVDHSLSHGINGLKGTRNSSTLFNLAWNTSFMWDGGVNNLEVQPINPITNPVEMDSNLEDVIKKLNGSFKYRKLFFNAFNDSVASTKRLLKSLSQFMLLFESYNSKYDKVVKKEKGIAFTPEEKRGYALFKKNCSNCHSEPLFTNNSIKNNGLEMDKDLNDAGRMKITNNPADSLKFKIPPLRNIAVSAPYMHDGRFRDLQQVLDHYTDGIVDSPTLASELKKKMVLSANDKKDIISFLNTLTDKEFLFDLRFRNHVIK